MRMSHIVLKASDLTKALENLPKGNHDFNNILSEYSKVRKDQGKLSDHRYIVVNMDEPYVNDVIAVLEKNGHWRENPSEFTHAEIQAALQESYEDMLKAKVESQLKLIDELRIELTKAKHQIEKWEAIFDNKTAIHDKLNRDYTKMKEENKRLREALGLKK